ncbi:MAG: VanZ family protein [Eubacteriales bacterium]|nr:VanZ family protein [Eubacteriales bacterium]
MKKGKFHLVCKWIIFIIYMACLIYLVFFAESMGRTHVQQGYAYNLEPLKEIRRFWKYIFSTEQIGLASRLNIFGNVIAFIPFGLCLPLISDHRLKCITTLLYTFALSLIIELVQLISKVGSFDVDDLVLNCMGGLVGYLLYYVLHRLRMKSVARKKEGL